MTPLKLRLVGFIGIKSGTGLDEINLDLSKLDADQQLVAIVGHNGAGKSTVMDNLHPYRLMPSRATGFTPSSFSYWDHVYGSECLKELEWSYGEALYRSTLLFKNSGKTKKAESYLHQFKDGAWVPVHLPDGTLSDGKTDTYDKCVEGIMGPPETFFTCGFSAQKRKPISSYSNGEIKSLMADLLGIENIRQVGKNAARVGDILKAELSKMREAMTRVFELEAKMPNLVEALSVSSAAHDSLVTQAESAGNQVRTAQAAHAKAVADLESAKTINSQRTQLQEAIRLADQESSSNQAQLSHDITRESARLQRLQQENVSAVSNHAVTIQQLNQQVERQQAILALKPSILEANSKMTELRDKATSLQQVLDAALTEERAYLTEIGKRDTQIASLSGLKRDGTGQRDSLNELKGRVILIEQVPCAGNSMQGKCQLLQNVMADKAKIPELEAKLQEIVLTYNQGKITLEQLEKGIAAYGDIQGKKIQAQQAVAAHALVLNATQELASKLPQLNDAEANLQSLSGQIDQRTSAEQSRVEAYEQEKVEIEKLLSDLNTRKTKVVTDCTARVNELKAELNNVPEGTNAFEVMDLESAVQAAVENQNRLNCQVSEAIVETTRIKSTIDLANQEIAAAEAAKAKITFVENEISYWAILAKAFSNNGIVALSIDDAGPHLTRIVNQLMTSCFGSRFTVSILTQTETGKGELREDFEIMVHDAESNKSTSVTVMSGGEQIWINEALIRGIALYLSEASGHSSETLFSDEADGPLDPQKKLQFLRMKREVLRIGGYKREFYISHTPDIVMLADSKIDMKALPAATA